MTGILSDVRFACRSLRANASLMLLAVACLGIGIGATTMAFTVINNALLEPLGSIDPDGLVGIAEIRESTPARWWPASWANFRDWEASVDQGAQMSALRGSSFEEGPNTSDARVEGAYVTHDLFAVLGVAPILGRGLQAGDDDAGSEPVVVLSETFWRQRIFSLWFTFFGIAALVLTGVGIYGVLAYLVSQRWREIGIRMAVGADRHKVLLMILGQAARLVGAGILVGLVGACLLARGMRALLFGVESLDMAVFVGVAVFLAVAVMASSLMPAIRAARMDANDLLRN